DVREEAGTEEVLCPRELLQGSRVVTGGGFEVGGHRIPTESVLRQGRRRTQVLRGSQMRGSRSELAQLPEDSCEPDMEIGLARQRRCGVLLSDPEVMLEERAGPVRATEPDEHGADGDGGRQGAGDVPCRLESC